MKKISILWILFVSACTPTSPLELTRWSGQGPQPHLDISKSDLKSEPLLSSSNEEVQFQQQLAGTFKVDGGFVKSVYKNDKSLVFQSSALVKKVSAFKLLHAEKLNNEKETIWKKFLKKNNEYNNGKLISPLEVLFIHDPKFLSVVRAYIEINEQDIFSIDLNENGQLIKKNRVGSNLGDMIQSPSLAFPKGPLKSQLTPILISRNNQPEGLADHFIEVFSFSPLKILQTSDLEYQPTDDRFDQVQAFYFSHLILQWFQQKLSIQVPTKLSIITRLGFPEKTNAAFYFQNQIRFGAGDDVTYSNMAWDPSIVMHETSHSVIDSISHLSFQGENGSLNEGFADTFTTFYLDSPFLGENSYLKGPYKRTVDQTIKLSEKNGGLYHDSAIVSSFFWSLKKIVGADKALNLAVHVLNRLGPSSNFDDFKLSLTEQSALLFDETELKKVDALLQAREL